MAFRSRHLPPCRSAMYPQRASTSLYTARSCQTLPVHSKIMSDAVFQPSLPQPSCGNVSSSSIVSSSSSSGSNLAVFKMHLNRKGPSCTPPYLRARDGAPGCFRAKSISRRAPRINVTARRSHRASSAGHHRVTTTMQLLQPATCSKCCRRPPAAASPSSSQSLCATPSMIAVYAMMLWVAAAMLESSNLRAKGGG